ncbi:MAG TPA: alpha/beta fold hydrolase, partial [Pyrinomonadaceae bacterium]|nr:alpha/beta fold hydrolase [Pyrinomonadaceae bacterium]
AAPHVPLQNLSARLRPVARAFRVKPFVPHKLFGSGHAQTTYAALRLSRPRRLRDAGRDFEPRLVEVEPGARLLVKCHWQADRSDAPTLLLIHGLEGSSESLYIRGTARKALSAGFNVVRMNMRNCGDTEHLTETLYHSGMTGDIHRVLTDELAGRERLREIFVAGFSMSANMVLRLAGEYGDDAPPSLAGVVAVSPPVDLAGCAGLLERRENALYLWSFMRSLRRRVRRKRRLNPELYDARGLRRVRTLRQFDERYTAPHGGFRDAADYYERASSLPLIHRIKVPTLVIHAEDDPFVPAAPLRDSSFADNPNVLLVITRQGGHVAFISAGSEDEDRHWAENRIVEFCRMLSGGNHHAPRGLQQRLASQ